MFRLDPRRHFLMLCRSNSKVCHLAAAEVDLGFTRKVFRRQASASHQVRSEKKYTVPFFEFDSNNEAPSASAERGQKMNFARRLQLCP